MNKPYNFFILFFSALILAACSGSRDEDSLSLEEDFNEVEINGQYKMHVPDYMSVSYELNDEASLQYQYVSPPDEAYVIIIDEPKDEFIEILELIGGYDEERSVVENYANVQVEFLTENIDVNVQTDGDNKNIHGLEAVTVEIEGMADGVYAEIFYYLTFVEGADDLYMIMAWTLQSDKDEYEAQFDMMVGSFEEL